MNQDKLNEIIKNQWNILPEDIRELVLSSELEAKVNWISGKYNLSAEQTDSLKQETLFVLVGLIHIMDYTENVMRELNISKEQARVIAQEVGTQIFFGVKEILKELGWVIEMKKETESGVTTKDAREEESPTPTIIQKKEDIMPNTPVAGILIEQTEKEGERPAEQVEENKINKAVLLEEIEHPALISEHSGTVVDQKLGGIVKIPREEVKVNISNTIPEKKYQGTDPYREPIE